MTDDQMGEGPSFLAGLARRRDTLRARIREDLEADERVGAAWLEGSFGRGTEDAWSDIDLHVVVRDEALTAWLGGRDDWFARLGHPVMVMPSSASEKGDWQGVLFAGPVFLDLAVHPGSTATREADTPLLFARVDIPIRTATPLDDDERRSRLRHDLDFFWAMTPIALKYIGRGRTDRALTMVGLLSETFVRLWRLVHDPARRDAGGAHWLHPERDLDLVRLMPSFGAVVDQIAALEAVSRLMDEVCQLDPALDRFGVAIPIEAVTEIGYFRDAVARACSSVQAGSNSSTGLPGGPLPGFDGRRDHS